KEPWKLGESREVVLSSVRAGSGTEITVLGQNDKALEYQTEVPKTTWSDEAGGLHVRFTCAQRLRDNRQGVHPVVLKITHAQAAKNLLRAETGTADWDSGSRAVKFLGNLSDLGGASEVQAGFEYRDITGQDTDERTSAWTRTPLQSRSEVGAFSATVNGLSP